MDRKQTPSPTPSPTPSSPDSAPGLGIGRDLRQIRHGGAASAAELRQFLQQIRGRSPRDMLGSVAQSGLVRATITASIGFLVLLVALTIVPFGYSRIFPDAKSAAKSDQAAAAESAPPGAAATAGATPQVAPATTAANPQAPAAGQSDILNKLGIGQEKRADPKANPLDAKTDDLLKGLE